MIFFGNHRVELSTLKLVKEMNRCKLKEIPNWISPVLGWIHHPSSDYPFSPAAASTSTIANIHHGIDRETDKKGVVPRYVISRHRFNNNDVGIITSPPSSNPALVVSLCSEVGQGGRIWFCFRVVCHNNNFIITPGCTRTYCLYHSGWDKWTENTGRSAVIRAERGLLKHKLLVRLLLYSLFRTVDFPV